jgi:hypothetical protein
LTDRISACTFHAASDFQPGPQMPARFDFAIAQSVFTHLTLPHLQRCLRAIMPRMREGRRLYATFFTAPREVVEFRHERGGVVTYAHKDPFHYHEGVIRDAADFSGCIVNWIGEWDHPRDQQIVEFIRGAPPWPAV